MGDLFYLPTPEAFIVFNRLVKARISILLKIVSLIDMLAILKATIIRMRKAGELVFKQNQELGVRTLVFLIICETINISNIRVEIAQNSVTISLSPSPRPPSDVKLISKNQQKSAKMSRVATFFT